MARITIVGLGGIGSNLAEDVARLLLVLKDETHTLTLVDGKNFEARKRERQSFETVGNKAMSTQQKLASLFPELQIDAIAEFLSPETADYILFEDEIVLLCPDNHSTRRLASKIAETRENMVLISGGNDDWSGNIQIYVRQDGLDKTPPLTYDHPEIEDPTEKAPYELSCEELAQAGSPQVFAANLAVASAMFSALSRLLLKPETFLSDIQGEPPISEQTAYSEMYFDCFRGRSMARCIKVREDSVVKEQSGVPNRLERDIIEGESHGEEVHSI